MQIEREREREGEITRGREKYARGQGEKEGDCESDKRKRKNEGARECESDGTKADGRLCWLLAAAAATQVETKCTSV